MDKRTIMALVLVALVIIITPKLFPTSTRRAATPVSLRDTTHRDAVQPAVSKADRGEQDSVSVRRDSIAPVEANVTVMRTDTTLIASSTASYAFTNVGGVPTAVTLGGYRALDKSNRQVVLRSRGRPLIGYKLVSVGDTIDLAHVVFQTERSVNARGESVITYQGAVRGQAIALTYTVIADSFLTRVGVVLSRDSAKLREPAFVLISLPSTLESSEADTLDDQKHLAYAVKPIGRNAEGITFGSLDPGERHMVQGPIMWAAVKSKYFMIGVLAAEASAGFAEMTATGGPRVSRTATEATGTLVARVSAEPIRFELYTGPQKWKQLHALGREFENSNPYGGWLQGVVQPFATMVLRVLLWMRDSFKLGYGWILVIFGIAVRTILWPLNQTAMRTSMKMQRIQPELNEIQKRYKTDPQKLQSEMMRVYKEHGMSPFSTFAGCLPLFLPMPVLFALFFVFQNTIEFRGVPFLWLTDISVRDPFYIIPLFMGISMFGLSWIGMRNAPPNPQAKVMLYVFPVMMTLLFANFASGLNLYYAVQNIAAIPQQWLIANERARNTAPKKS